MIKGHEIDICVIAGHAEERAALAQTLRGWQYSVVEAEDGATGLHCIYQHRPRVLICDDALAQVDGLQLCRHMRADPTLDGTYTIITSRENDVARKYQALSAGADEFLLCPLDWVELKSRVRNGMRFHRIQERLHQAAITDGLTGLWNYNQFRQLLEYEFTRSRRYGGVCSLLMLDLDHFKAINDTYGHEVGNTVLKRMAAHLQASVRDCDIVARYGGEEFAVICPQTAIIDAGRLAERMRVSIHKTVQVPQHPQIEVFASIGVSSTEDPRATTVSELIDRADQALYHSKRTGRNRVTCADAEMTPAVEREVPHGEVDRLRKEVVSLNMRSKDICLQSVWALIQALEARDGYSAWHSRNVKLYTRWMVEAAMWPAPLAEATMTAAMLHDLGKIGISDALLLKTPPLSDEDAAVLRQVPLLTCRILEPLRVFQTEISMIRHIRERWDGTGTPDGLAGEDIPIGSRMICVAEAFDSLTTNRAYRPGRSVYDAIDIIRECAGRQFDPGIVGLLERIVSEDIGRWEEHVAKARADMPGAPMHAGAELDLEV